jgi:LysR family transcriptional regulator, hydrogen peroxide-inducible genes activator
MNINDLKYLVAVAETQHFGKAADLCFVSQPTLSMQLKKLEEELDIKIFERTNKKVFVTESGKKILEKARRVLSEVNDLKQVAKNQQNPYCGEFHLGIIPTMGPYLLPKLMPMIQSEHPNLELIPYEDKTEVILDRLNNGELDAILLALPVDHGSLVEKKLFTEDFYAAVPPDNPLAKQAAVTLSDLESQKLLLLGEGHCFRDQALAACRYTGAQLKSGFQATSLETLRYMVAAGAGVTLLPAMMVESLPDHPDVVILPFKGTAPSRVVGLLWRQNSPATLVSQEISKLLHS